MPSFYVRNIARYFALSLMEKSSRPSISPKIDDVVEGVNAWNKNMRWLIPFVQASGYHVVIENPKSHEKIVIDKDTKNFPQLSSSWLRRYDKQELKTWMTKEKEKEEVRHKIEKFGRAKYGDGYKASEQDIQKVLDEMQ